MGYISGASAVTAGMIIADIFGCLGICSGVVTTGTWIAGATTAETAIAKYGVEIKNLENQVVNAITDFTYEQMQAIKAFQNIFANSIGKLKSAAQNFHDFASSTRPSLQDL